MMDKKTLILSSIAGLIMALGYPTVLSGVNIFGGTFPNGLFTFIGLALLFHVLKTNGKNFPFFKGFLAGLSFNFMALFWVSVAMIYFGDMSIYESIAILIVMVIYLAIYTGLFTFLVAIMSRKFPFTIAAPFLAVSIELLRNYITIGFPWLNIGYSLAGISQLDKLTQICDMTGIYGLTWLCVLFAACAIESVSSDAKGKRYGRIGALISALILILGTIYGSYRIDRIRPFLSNALLEAQPTFPNKISILQGNIPQDQKERPNRLKDNLEKYFKMTDQTASFEPSLIIWPEASYPYIIHSYENELSTFNSRGFKSRFLIGSIFVDRESGKRKSYNSAFFVAPGGEILGRYDKMFLVPFSEQVVFEDYIPFIRKLVPPIAGDFGSGKEYKIFDLGDKKFSVLICFESIYPAVSRNFVKDGADFLVNITNDAWFGNTSGPYQHFEIARIRAIENRVYLLRSANTGISAIIDPVGNVSQKSALFEDATINSTIYFRKIGSLYTKIGDLFAYICTATTLLFLIISLIRKKPIH
jgi:apolipoprotein N-acyltransferase